MAERGIVRSNLQPDALARDSDDDRGALSPLARAGRKSRTTLFRRSPFPASSAGMEPVDHRDYSLSTPQPDRGCPPVHSTPRF